MPPTKLGEINIKNYDPEKRNTYRQKKDRTNVDDYMGTGKARKAAKKIKKRKKTVEKRRRNIMDQISSGRRKK